MAVNASERAGTALTARARSGVPEGVVTFLLTDVEGSSRRWEQDRVAMGAAVALHDEIVERVVLASGGVRPVEQGEGDSVVVAFAHASAAVGCALELQRSLQAADWPKECTLRVRIALHSGEAQLRDATNYVGPAITRCARLRDIANGGQTLLSRSTFELVVDHLPRDAGLRPLGPQRLKDLGRPEEVFELVHPELPSDFPALRSLDVLPNNLPVRLSSFVGRETELAEIGRLLREARLITLVGAGGCGKSSLAIQVAADQVEHYRDGAWFVDLGPVADPAFVVKALAASLGLPELPGQSLLERVTDRLRERRTLIVLDNCEHVVAEAAGVCEELLRRCPEVWVLATSRESLGAEGEVDYRVPSLGVPAADTPVEHGQNFEAVRLFVERAQSGRPSFEVSAGNWPAVVSICTQLDGMPLALELAAARMRALSPDQIAEGLGSRFALLSGGPRTALPRQQTLQHSIDWSYDLLDENERAVLRRASIFVGGFDLEAAETVCAGDGIGTYAVLDLLSRLVDKSLVQVEESGPENRYRLLETIRQYAGQKLADSDEGGAARDRHLAHYVALAEQAAPALQGHDQLAWFARLDREQDNLRAAADWAVASGDADRHARLAASLWLFWTCRGHPGEGLALAEAALASGGGSPRVRGSALLALSDLAMCIGGDFAGGRGPAEEALAIGRETDDAWLMGHALGYIGWSDLVTAGPAAKATLSKALDAHRGAGDVLGLSWVQNALGLLEFHLGHPERARELLHDALALARECGNRKAIYMPLAWLAWLQTDAGEYDAAEQSARDGLATAREVNDPLFAGMCLHLLGGVRMQTGDYGAARELFDEALAIGREYKLPHSTAWALAYLCRLEAWTGDAAAGLAGVEEALAFGEPLGLRRYTDRWLCAKAEAAHAAGDRELAATCWDEAVERGREAGDRWVLGEALHGQALMARERGHAAEAERLAHEALSVLCSAEASAAAIDVVESLAGIYVELESFDRAARLIGATEAERARRGQPRPPAHERRLASDLERLRAEEVAAEAGATMTLDEAIAYVSRGRGSRERPGSGWASLTPAELEVVRLVADGLTNPQVGERLFISKRTVQAHLSHVFRKLGVSNRAELAAQAARQSE